MHILLVLFPLKAVSSIAGRGSDVSTAGAATHHVSGSSQSSSEPIRAATATCRCLPNQSASTWVLPLLPQIAPMVTERSYLHGKLQCLLYLPSHTTIWLLYQLKATHLCNHCLPLWIWIFFGCFNFSMQSLFPACSPMPMENCAMLIYLFELIPAFHVFPSLSLSGSTHSAAREHLSKPGKRQEYHWASIAGSILIRIPTCGPDYDRGVQSRPEQTNHFLHSQLHYPVWIGSHNSEHNPN